MNFKRPLFSTLFLSTLTLLAQTPNWSEHVAPILYANCTGCHIQGSIAGFSLVKYSEAVDRKYSIKDQVETRKMPPWPADPNFRRYSHEKILSAQEIKTIQDWVNGGTPKGDTTKAPPEPKVKTGSEITNPSLKLKMPNYSATTTDDEYRCFVMPTGLTQTQFITQIEVIPGNLNAVHHVLVYHDTGKTPLNLDAATSEPGYISFGGTGSSTSKMIGVWVPGQEPFYMPSGTGIKIGKNGYIVIQIHYPKGLTAALDSTKVLLKLTTVNQREVFIAPAINHDAASLTNGPLFIPANQKKTFYSKFDIGADISIFAVAPHMHLIGQSIKAYGVLGKDTTNFVNIPAWDFHWQRTYTFQKILKLPKGIRLWGEAFYNNTSSNPENPSNPPKDVSLGERTTDEMMLVYFWYMLYKSGDENIVIDTTTPKNIHLASVFVQTSKEMRFYPNPVQDLLHFTVSNSITNKAQVQVFSLDGREIINLYPEIKENTATVNLAKLKTGIYFVRMIDGNYHSECKILKE